MTTTIDLEAGIREMYRRLDATDPSLFEELFALDAALIFNGDVVATGQGGILAFIRERESHFARVTHHLEKLAVDPDRRTAVAEIAVNFTPCGSDTVTVPGCGILDYREDRIAEWRIYIDSQAVPT
jgi:limonene-1,2-epoxide hydrolase